jgi:hypothetical protein
MLPKDLIQLWQQEDFAAVATPATAEISYRVKGCSADRRSSGASRSAGPALS